MASITANTAADYLAQLPPERRSVISAVRDVITKNLPAGYREAPGYGMITYTVPLERYPETYNGQPLCFVALAAQKNHYALYLMDVYHDPERARRLALEFERIGKRPDMGKSCIRFQRLEDLPLDAIGEVIAARSVDSFIASYEAARAAVRPRARKEGAVKEGAVKKPAGKATPSRTAANAVRKRRA